MKKRKNTLKIIASTSATLFSLFTLFVSSFAWFLAKRNADADGSGFITSKEESVLESVEIHEQTTSGVNYKYNENYSGRYVRSGSNFTYESSSSSKIDIGSYDRLLNPNNSIFLLFKLKTDASDDSYKFNVTCKTDTTYATSPFYVNSEKKLENELTESGNKLSSIIAFSSHTFSSTVSYDFSNETISSTSIADIDTSSSSVTYHSSLNLLNNTSKILAFGLILEYNVENIEYLYSLNIGNPLTGTGDEDEGKVSIKFDDIDFTLEM